MKSLIINLLIVFSVVMASCNNEEGGKKRRMDFSKVKPELNLSKAQEEKFDAIVEKYTKIREASREAGNTDRSAMMEKMRGIIKQQNAEIVAILEGEQVEKYNQFAKRFERFGKPGYSDELMAQLKTELNLDDQQATMLEAVNKAFEKSYVNAHDYYHGNSEAAKEYWNKFDQERRSALEKVMSDEQYAKFLNLVEEHGFQGEHGKPENK